MTRPPAGPPSGSPAEDPAAMPSSGMPPGDPTPSQPEPSGTALPNHGSTTPDPPTQVPGKPGEKAAPGRPGEKTEPADAAENDVLLTARQRKRAERDAIRQAKDEAYELRMQRKKAKDGTTWRGHNVVDTAGLARAFPEPETPELLAGTVRRRITHATVLILLLALVVAGMVLVGMVQRGELELKLGSGRPSPTPWSCPTEVIEYPANKSVTVNVYNGSSVEGLAGKVAAELTKRGYQVKAVDNKAVSLPAPSVIVSGPAGHAAALNLQRNFPNSEYVEDSREGATVDVVLTSQFTALVDAKKVDQKAGPLSCPRLSPPPSDEAATEAASVKPPSKP